jgi:hypothetical protein
MTSQYITLGSCKKFPLHDARTTTRTTTILDAAGVKKWLCVFEIIFGNAGQRKEAAA